MLKVNPISPGDNWMQLPGSPTLQGRREGDSEGTPEAEDRQHVSGFKDAGTEIQLRFGAGCLWSVGWGPKRWGAQVGRPWGPLWGHPTMPPTLVLQQWPMKSVHLSRFWQPDGAPKLPSALRGWGVGGALKAVGHNGLKEGAGGSFIS